MSEVAIRVDGLGKMYHLGAGKRRHKYSTLRDKLTEGAKTTLRSLIRRGKRAELRPTFWALKDVSFEVARGEVVGVIGRNGAGKSTLLKVLSRVTEPTEGGADIHGRVGSLLEVGTGFHPELTGRENLFLNGAILGMRKAEITRKFDEIVAFAECEKFVDTPVKHYSSGMYTRLAFAVAAHLEPEILIVDEVLAVGDSGFQKKCLGKMGEVAKGGRTVLFVSHNMGAIGSLCSRGIVLDGGKVAFVGPVTKAIETYNAGVEAQVGHRYTAADALPMPHFKSVLVAQDGVAGPPFRIDREIHVRFEVDPKDSRELVVAVRVRNSQGVTVIHSTDEYLQSDTPLPPGMRCCTLPPHALAAGNYFIRAAILVRGGEVHQVLEDVISFEVEFAGHLAERSSGLTWVGVCGPGLPRWSA